VLSDLVAQRARENARDPFCYFEDQVITFGELAERSTGHANSLSSSGVAAGDRVGVMMGNHPDHVYELLALAQLGAVHVPLNVHLKSAGIRHVIDDSEISVVLADERYEEELGKAIAGHSRVITTLGPDPGDGHPHPWSLAPGPSLEDPERLAMIPPLEYLRDAGAEAIELVMWLIMRGALGERVREVHRFYHVPASSTAVGHIILEAV